MNQLFLAVEKAAGAGLKGHILSRYGPANTLIGLNPFDRHPPESRRTSALSSITAAKATLTPVLTLRSNALHHTAPKPDSRPSAMCRRKIMQPPSALYRGPMFNALEAPLLR